MAYLTVTQFKARTIMPGADFEQLEAAAPQWLATQLESVSRLQIDARLRKRYACPFDESDPPEAVRAWVTRIVTMYAYFKRGIEQTDPAWQTVREEFNEARAEIKEAADAVDGLFDLPLRGSSTQTGIVLGAPLGYSEPGPYDWTDRQREAVQNGG